MTHRDYLQMVDQVNEFRQQIHLFDEEVISEELLDNLKHQITLFEEQNPELISTKSPNKNVSGGVKKGFAKFTHIRRMLSLNDIFDQNELTKWEKRWQDWADKNEIDWQNKTDNLGKSSELETSEIFLENETEKTAKKQTITEFRELKNLAKLADNSKTKIKKLKKIESLSKNVSENKLDKFDQTKPLENSEKNQEKSAQLEKISQKNFDEKTDKSKNSQTDLTNEKDDQKLTEYSKNSQVETFCKTNKSETKIKTQNLENFRENKIKYICEPKIDGLAVSLHYENGFLVSGATRGDGFVGENITQNLMQISSIPKKINQTGKLEVRGEVFITKDNFQKLNQEIANGQKIGKMGKFGPEAVFSNPRNAASGTLRQLEAKIVKERNLSFVAYGLYLEQ